jgi:hypothetical protein
MIKTKTFVLKTSTAHHGTESAAEQLDDMIKAFIEGKTAESPSFKVINIQYCPTLTSTGRGLEYWVPSAMLVYDQE